MIYIYLNIHVLELKETSNLNPPLVWFINIQVSSS